MINEKDVYTLSGDELRLLQLTQLKILKIFAKFCSDHNLTWQLAAGTLLGAVRYKAFIPWDDDIDVIMPRHEYERMLTLIATLPDNVFLQNYKTEPNCPFLFSKLRLNNTCFKEVYYKEIEMHHGVFIDIFPYDRIEPKTVLGRFHLFGCRFLNLIFLFLGVSSSNEIGGKRNVLLKYAFKSLHFFTRRLPKPFFPGFFNWWFGLLSNTETSYWTCLVDAPFDSKKFYARFARDEIVSKLNILQFEDGYFPATAYPDEMLKRLYNNYWEKPPITEQVPHHHITEFYVPPFS